MEIYWRKSYIHATQLTAAASPVRHTTALYFIDTNTLKQNTRLSTHWSKTSEIFLLGTLVHDGVVNVVSRVGKQPRFDDRERVHQDDTLEPG